MRPSIANQALLKASLDTDDPRKEREFQMLRATLDALNAIENRSIQVWYRGTLFTSTYRLLSQLEADLAVLNGDC